MFISYFMVLYLVYISRRIFLEGYTRTINRYDTYLDNTGEYIYEW